MTAEGNRTCMIMLRLSDLKSQASLSLFLRHHELITENVSHFLINQWKTKTFTKPVKDGGSIVSIVLEIQKREDDEIPVYFTIHEIKTKGYDIIGINVLLSKLMRFFRKKADNSVPKILLQIHFFYIISFSVKLLLRKKRGSLPTPLLIHLCEVRIDFYALLNEELMIYPSYVVNKLGKWMVTRNLDESLSEVNLALHL